jgi:hypothetical protein
MVVPQSKLIREKSLHIAIVSLVADGVVRRVVREECMRGSNDCARLGYPDANHLGFCCGAVLQTNIALVVGFEGGRL